MNIKATVAAMFAASALATPAWAGDMVYTPISPSFGGNPLNSSHLLATANAQRTATARDAKRNDPTDPTNPTTPGSTDADLFIRQLQGRLLSALASQVTEAIFGQNPQESGTVTFGETTVTFERTLTSIKLTIVDPTGTTVIEVPQLVTSTAGAGLNASAAPQPFSAGSVTAQGDLTTGSFSPSLGGGAL